MPSAPPNGFDPEQYRPQPDPAVHLLDRGPAEPDARYLLAHDETNAALVISQNDKQLWDLFDGERSVRDICADYLEQHQALALTRIYTLIHSLWERGMLRDDPQFADQMQDLRRPQRFRLHHLFGVPIPGTDKLIRGCGRLLRYIPFHSWPVIAILLLLGGAGIVLSQRTPVEVPFLVTASPYHVYVGKGRPWKWRVHPEAYTARSDPESVARLEVLERDYSRLVVLPQSYGLGLVLLLILHLVASFCREFARSSVVAGYTGRAPPLHLVVTYGIPAFRALTPWHLGLPRRKRLLCDCFGLLFELGLAAVLFALLPLVSGALGRELMTKLGWICYARTFFHLAPLEGSDLQTIMGDWSNLRNFRRRAMGFLRKRLCSAVVSDRPMSREERIYTTFLITALAWLFVAAHLGLVLMEQHQAEIRELILNLKSVSWWTLTAIVLIGIPVLVTSILALAWVLHWLWTWILEQPRLRSPVSFVGAAVFIILTTTGFFEISRRQDLLGRGLLTTLVYAINLILVILTMYQVKRHVPHEKGHTRVKLLVIFCLALATGLAVVARRLHVSSSLIMPLTAIVLLAAAAYLIVSFAKGQHVLARWATDYGPAELSTTGGCLLLGVAAGLQLNAVTHGAEFSRFTLMTAMGLALTATGQAAWLRALGTVERCGFSLAISPHVPDGRALTNICNYILDRIGQITKTHFGREALDRLEKQVRNQCSFLDFTFREPYFPNQTEPDQLADIYREMILCCHSNLSHDHSVRFAEAAFKQVFRQVHWQAKTILDKYVLAGTPWENRFRKEIAVDLKARRAMLNGITMFQDLSTAQKNLLVQYMAIERYAPGDLIIRQGDLGDTSYILVAGEVQVEEEDLSSERHILALLHEGDFFGEAALLDDVRRVASIRATSQVAVLCLQKDDLERIELRSPETVQIIRERLQTYQVLLRIPLFSDLPTNLLRTVLPRIESQVMAPGETVIKQGDRGREFYLIKSGSVEVLKTDDEGERRKVATLSAGSYFGEIALLKNVPRTATVQTATETELYVISTEDFLRLLSGSRLFAMNLSAVGEMRLLA